MNIIINARAANAIGGIRQIQSEVNKLNSATTAAGSAATNMITSDAITRLGRWGSQIQWAGRQLIFNFTMPLAAAATAGVKMSMDLGSAMVRVGKVYGDSANGAALYARDVDGLTQAFRLLSEQYGVTQSNVAEIAGDWTAAGAVAGELANGVESTLKTMILGEMEAADATEALIAIQAQYGANSEQLIEIINKLNMAENESGATFDDLVRAMARSAGAARTAGVDINHLVAMITALVPAAGGAEQAGNSLRTMISRIMAPVTGASDIMKAMGINTSDVAWTSLGAAERIERLAVAFHNLEGATDDMVSSQASRVSAEIASRWNINRFDVLMRAVYAGMDDNAETNSYYTKTLDALADQTEVNRTALNELNAVLESNPMLVKRAGVAIQNGLLEVMQVLMPQIMWLINLVRDLVQRFSELDPGIQKAIIGFAAFLALLGPPIVMMGAMSVAIARLVDMFRVGGLAVGMFLNPFKGIGKLVTHIPIIGGIVSALTRTGPAAAAAAGGVSAAATAAGAASSAIAKSGGGIRGVIGNIGANVRIFALLVQDSFNTLPVTMSRMLGVITSFGTSLGGILSGVAARVAAFVSVVASYFGSGGRIAAAISSLGATIRAALAGAFTLPSIGALFAGIIAGIKGLVAGIPGMFLGAGRAVIAFFMQLGPALWGALGGALASIGPKIIALITGPFGVALAAVVSLVAIFQEQIGQFVQGIRDAFNEEGNHIASALQRVWQGIVNLFNSAIGAVMDGFNALPQGVQNAIRSVVNIISSAATQIYEWFSYINPFARHSPSLVENVQRGMALVGDFFGIASERIGKYAKSAYNSFQNFSTATATFMDRYADMQRAEDRALISEQIGSGAASAYEDLSAKLKFLKVDYAQVGEAASRQKAVTAQLKDASDAASAAYEEQRNVLDGLNDSVSNYGSQLETVRGKLQEFASAPLNGMREMSDRMFENEMAQKRLRLALMDWEDVNGSVDDTKNAMSRLRGEIESLRGEANDLLYAGAGSDVLGPIRDQINQMEMAYREMEGSAASSPAVAMTSELERLQREAERLDLENAIRFDPLTRQIEQMSESYNELSFEEVVAGIREQRGQIELLELAYTQAELAAARQEEIVNAAKVAADAAKAAYDAEAQALNNLQDAYSAIGEEVRFIESEINAVISAAGEMGSALEAAARAQSDAQAQSGAASGSLSPALQGFTDSAGGAYEDVGGSNVIGGEDLSIDEWLSDKIAEMGDLWAGLDPFTGIRTKWEELKAWWNQNVVPIWTEFKYAFSNLWGNIDWSPVTNAIQAVADFWNEWIQPIVDVFLGVIVEQLENAWAGISSSWGEAWGEIQKKIQPLLDAVKGFWDNVGERILPALAAAFGVVAGVVVGVMSGIVGAIAGAVGPIVSLIGTAISSVTGIITGVINAVNGIIKFVSGLVDFVVKLFTGDWTGLGKSLSVMWDGIMGFFGGVLGIFGSLWNGIVGVFRGGINLVIGIVGGFIDGIVGFFQGIYDWLVGNSLVPDLVNAIVGWFTNMAEWVGGIWDGFKNMLSTVWNWIDTNVLAPIKAGIDLVAIAFDVAGIAIGVAWEAMRNGLDVVFQWIVKWIFDPIKAAVDLVGLAFTAVKDTILGAWDLVKVGVNAAVTWIIDNVFPPFDTAIQAIGTAFETVRDVIDIAWNAIKEIAVSPVNFIINTVYNDGIKSVWNSIADAIGLDDLKLPDVSPISFARGTEDHRAQIARAGAMRLWAEPETGGEAYIPLARQKRQRSTEILAKVANKFGYGLMKFEDGGILDGIGGFFSGAWNFITGAGEWLINGAINVAKFLGDPVQGIKDMIRTPVEALADLVGAKDFGRMLIELPFNIIDGLIDKVVSTLEGLVGPDTYNGELNPDWVRPSAGPVTSRYGMRFLFGTYNLHNGIDIAGGGRTYAANRGVVRRVGWNVGYGNTGVGILISHGGGLESYYGHNPENGVQVAPGQVVNAGQHIGYQGSTGRVTGTHLHYSIFKNGRSVDPSPYGIYDNGGYLPRGLSIVANNTGSPEPVLSPSQWASLDAMVGAINKNFSAGESMVVNDNRSFNFYGDLSFPNVEDASDAEDFIRNLTDLGAR